MERPEQRLLLACAWSGGEEERRERIASCLGGPIDWEHLLEAAGRHRLLPLLYWRLNAGFRDAMPPAVFKRLHDYFVANDKKSLELTAELLRILKLFEANSITAIPFKGPVLAYSLYEHPALRNFVDLDILVHHRNVFRALRLLPELGYREIARYSRAQERWIIDREYHLRLDHADRRSFVELHWNVLARHFLLPLSIEGWWERAGSVMIQTRQVSDLSAEDLLVALCAHGCKHMWQTLAWILDLAKLLERRQDLDWDYIFEQCAHMDLKRIIFLGLNVVHRVLDAPVREDVLREAKEDRPAMEIARRVERELFAPHGEHRGMRFVRFQMKLKSSPVDKMRFCFRTLSTPSLTEPYPLLHSLISPFYKLQQLWMR